MTSDRRTAREDGIPHVTPVVDARMCEFCGSPIEVRKEGRRRRFCDSTCRTGAHRRSMGSKRCA